MPMIEIRSSIIISLEEEILEGNTYCLEKFWTYAKANRTPIIEEIENDDKNSLITFVYKGDCNTNNVVILGEFPGIDYTRNQMKRMLNTDLWYKTYIIRNDICFVYYFSVNDSLNNDWITRRKRMQFDSLSKYKIKYKKTNSKDIILSYAQLNKFKEQLWIKTYESTIEGNVEKISYYSLNLENYINIWIYIPPVYNENCNENNVLVLINGFEYINNIPTVKVLNNLLSQSKIPPLITVFIEYDEEKPKDLPCSIEFENFIINELIAYVRNKYNVTANPYKTIIGGINMGALIATYLSLKYYNIFGNVLSQSGAFWWSPMNPDEIGWLITQFNYNKKLDIKFYLDVGVLEDRDKFSIVEINEQMKNILMLKGYDISFNKFKGGHDCLCRGESLAKGLIYLIGNKTNG